LAAQDRVGYIEPRQIVEDPCELPRETPLTWKEQDG
jgi:hypothetical protein